MPLRTVEAVRLYQRIAGGIAAAIEAGAFPPGSQLPPERLTAVPFGGSRTSFRGALVSPEIAGSVGDLRPTIEQHSHTPAMRCRALVDHGDAFFARDAVLH